jgi:hypothetical protein
MPFEIRDEHAALTNDERNYAGSTDCTALRERCVMVISGTNHYRGLGKPHRG